MLISLYSLPPIQLLIIPCGHFFLSKSFIFPIKIRLVGILPYAYLNLMKAYITDYSFTWRSWIFQNAESTVLHFPFPKLGCWRI